MDNALLDRDFSPCSLCPRRCGASRLNGETGVCGGKDQAIIYQQFIHCGEELELSPAFIINLSGCNLCCPTCSERIHWETATRVWQGNAEEYANRLVPRLMHANVRSIEWIGGEPSIHLPFVLEATKRIKEALPHQIPFYFNTNGYYATELTPYITACMDGFVFDLKASRACAPRIVGGAEDYYDTVCENIIKSSTYKCSIIVRHLVMPGHVDCCTKPCVEWLRKTVPQARINVMTTFQNFNGCKDYPFELEASDLQRLKELDLN